MILLAETAAVDSDAVVEAGGLVMGFCCSLHRLGCKERNIVGSMEVYTPVNDPVDEATVLM